MKNTLKISGIISSFLMLLGAILKIQHIPFSTITFLISFVISTYGILNVLKAEKANQESNNSSYENIINQIGSWELADRIKVEIDFELARISAQHNPRLESGEYQLILSERPSNLYIFGAIEKPINTHYIDNTCVKDILSSLKFMHLADLSFIYIISPRGKVGKYGIANWNNECVLPMPGSTIYIPLQERLFSNQEKIINRKIVELATNRVVAK